MGFSRQEYWSGVPLRSLDKSLAQWLKGSGPTAWISGLSLLLLGCVPLDELLDLTEPIYSFLL